MQTKKTNSLVARSMLLLPLAVMLLGMRNLPMNSRGTESALLQRTVSDSVAEIQLSQLAQNRSQSEAVRRFAQRTIAVQEKIIRNAMHAAKVAALPQLTLRPSDSGVADYVQTISYHGHAFDQHYLNTYLNEHKERLADLGQSSSNVRTPVVVSFVNSTEQ